MYAKEREGTKRGTKFHSKNYLLQKKKIRLKVNNPVDRNALRTGGKRIWGNVDTEPP